MTDYVDDGHMMIKHNIGTGTSAYPISKAIAEQLVNNGYVVLDARLRLGAGNGVTCYYRAIAHGPVFETDIRNVDYAQPSNHTINDFGLGDTVKVLYYGKRIDPNDDRRGLTGKVTEIRDQSKYVRVDLGKAGAPLFEPQEVELISKYELTKKDFKVGDRVEVTEGFVLESDEDSKTWVGLAGTVVPNNDHSPYIKVDLDERPGTDLFLPKEIKPSDKPKPPAKEEVAHVLINGVEYTLTGPGASSVEISTTIN